MNRLFTPVVLLSWPIRSAVQPAAVDPCPSGHARPFHRPPATRRLASCRSGPRRGRTASSRQLRNADEHTGERGPCDGFPPARRRRSGIDGWLLIPDRSPTALDQAAHRGTGRHRRAGADQHPRRPLLSSLVHVTSLGYPSREWQVRCRDEGDINEHPPGRRPRGRQAVPSAGVPTKVDRSPGSSPRTLPAPGRCGVRRRRRVSSPRRLLVHRGRALVSLADRRRRVRYARRSFGCFSSSRGCHQAACDVPR